MKRIFWRTQRIDYLVSYPGKRTVWCSGKGGGGPEAALFFGASLLPFLEPDRSTFLTLSD
jgi:hypothetical protein